MTLTNRRDDEEQIDPRVVAAIRAATRAEQDDEYESSTPGAGRWRERIASSRHDHGPTAGEYRTTKFSAQTPAQRVWRSVTASAACSICRR